MKASCSKLIILLTNEDWEDGEEDGIPWRMNYCTTVLIGKTCFKRVHNAFHNCFFLELILFNRTPSLPPSKIIIYFWDILVNTLSFYLQVICSIVAVSIHFFFLASFMWMLVEGIHLLSKVKTVFQPINKLRIAYALAYGKRLLMNLNRIRPPIVDKVRTDIAPKSKLFWKWCRGKGIRATGRW